jgi:hypothetical protein
VEVGLDAWAAAAVVAKVVVKAGRRTEVRKDALI